MKRAFCAQYNYNYLQHNTIKYSLYFALILKAIHLIKYLSLRYAHITIIHLYNRIKYIIMFVLVFYHRSAFCLMHITSENLNCAQSGLLVFFYWELYTTTDLLNTNFIRICTYSDLIMCLWILLDCNIMIEFKKTFPSEIT